ncbi:MAG: type III polyketide synthase [Bacteroidetes bacterium]|nr:type III polyketide synthase [Bacteroidota bacterium]
MSKIISIGTAVPTFVHRQEHILPFMQRIYAPDKEKNRMLKFLYQHSGINTRYSVIPDYTRPAGEWEFYPPTENLEPFPTLEQRMQLYTRHAGPLSLQAISRCLEEAGPTVPAASITHLITVSCTGMSAPGLDLELVEALHLPPTTFRTSINFMGCYAAVHALQLADAFVRMSPDARVLVVCTELCTLHFQQGATLDNMLSSLLFADGSAAALIVSDDHGAKGVRLERFYSEIITEGRNEMTWSLSSTGFQMTLTGYVAGLIRADFAALVENALHNSGLRREMISHWCIHPGGKKILEAIYKSLSFANGHLDDSYAILDQFGNMSSATILFVLKRMLDKLDYSRPNCIFGAAFGPGLTMETFLGTTN